jgi:hypothetical protein
MLLFTPVYVEKILAMRIEVSKGIEPSESPDSWQLPALTFVIHKQQVSSTNYHFRAI